MNNMMNNQGMNNKPLQNFDINMEARKSGTLASLRAKIATLKEALRGRDEIFNREHDIAVALRAENERLAQNNFELEERVDELEELRDAYKTQAITDSGRIDTLQSDLSAAEEMLLELEYCSYGSHVGQCHICCEWEKHQPDCKLGKMVEKIRSKNDTARDN